MQGMLGRLAADERLLAALQLDDEDDQNDEAAEADERPNHWNCASNDNTD